MKNKNLPDNVSVALEAYKGNDRVTFIISNATIKKYYYGKTSDVRTYTKPILRWINGTSNRIVATTRLIAAMRNTTPEDWKVEILIENLRLSQIANLFEDFECINDAPMVYSPEEKTDVIFIHHKPSGFKYYFSLKGGIEKLVRTKVPVSVNEKIFHIYHGITNTDSFRPGSRSMKAIEVLFDELSSFSCHLDKYEFIKDEVDPALCARDRTNYIRQKNSEFLNRWAKTV